MSSDSWTIRRVLDWSARDFRERGIDSPRLDAELLIAEALGIDRVTLYMDLDRPLRPEEREAIRVLVGRRRRREPVAYILGRREFWGRTFQVSSAVLIPRPDTETLVERALAILPDTSDARILDLGTGSGAIGLTLAAERPKVDVTCTDVSPAAIEIATANREVLSVSDRVRLALGDLFAAVSKEAEFDLITSNPPYIPDAEVETLAPEIREHEPAQAVRGGFDGLAVIERILRDAPGHLRPDGTLLIEIGRGQVEPIRARLEALESPLRLVGAHVDLGGIERVVELTWKPAAS